MNKSKCFLILCLTILNLSIIFAQNSTQTNKGIDNFTPSKSIYFDWINRNWYGSNEKKVEANLKFFKWRTFRLDIGESGILDKLVFKGIPADYNPETVEISNDLSAWHPVEYKMDDGELIIYPLQHESLRYLRLTSAPVEVAEIQGFINQTSMNRDKWRASNLFGLQKGNAVKLCWRYEGLLNGIAKGAYLSVSVPSNCREGTVYALMILDGKIIAANDRAPSWPYNNWEHYGISEKSLTFYIPVDDKMEGKSVQVMLLTTDRNLNDTKPEVWLTNPEIFEKAELILE